MLRLLRDLPKTDSWKLGLVAVQFFSVYCPAPGVLTAVSLSWEGFTTNKML